MQNKNSIQKQTTRTQPGFLTTQTTDNNDFQLTVPYEIKYKVF